MPKNFSRIPIAITIYYYYHSRAGGGSELTIVSEHVFLGIVYTIYYII